MANGPMSKGASPTNDPMANVLELPEASNAEDVAADVIAAAVDAEAPRRKTPNNQLILLNLFLTTCVRIRIIAI